MVQCGGLWGVVAVGVGLARFPDRLPEALRQSRGEGRGQVSDVLVGGRRERHEPRPVAFARSCREQPVRDQDVKMRVDVEGAAEALHERDGPAGAVHDASVASQAALPGEDGAQEVPQQVGEQHSHGLDVQSPANFSLHTFRSMASWRLELWSFSLTPEALGAKVFLDGEIVMSKKAFTLLKVTFWKTMDDAIRCKFTKKEEQAPDGGAADDDMPF